MAFFILPGQAHVDGGNTEDEPEHGPLYQRLHDKQHQKRLAEPKVETSQKAKVLSRREMEITPGLTCPCKI